jgi:hypothetical protein
MGPFVPANAGAPVDRPPLELPPFVSDLVLWRLDIRSVWSLDHRPGETPLQPATRQLLVFADLMTLRDLRKREDLHRTDVGLLVVVDGDAFENAWGSSCRGSLARWAWRQVSAHEAYYDEARWDGPDGNGGNVVRIRSKALLLWQEPPVSRRSFALHQ